MKYLFNLLQILFLMIFLASLTAIIAQEKEAKEINKIPETIEQDLVLTKKKSPYYTNGFTLARSATLTIEAGVKILPEKTKEKSSPVILHGTCLIGIPAGEKIHFEVPTTIEFSSASMKVYQTNFLSSTITFSGGTEGLFEQCSFRHFLTRSIKKAIEITIPKREQLTFKKCHFINHHITLPKSIVEQQDKILFESCAFTRAWDNRDKRYLPSTIDYRILFVGKNCDLFTFLKWEPVTAGFTTPHQISWFIKDKSTKQQANTSMGNIKNLNWNISPSPYTNFKPERPY